MPWLLYKLYLKNVPKCWDKSKERGSFQENCTNIGEQMLRSLGILRIYFSILETRVDKFGLELDAAFAAAGLAKPSQFSRLLKQCLAPQLVWACSETKTSAKEAA